MKRQEILKELKSIQQLLDSDRNHTLHIKPASTEVAKQVESLLDQWPSKGETVTILIAEIKDMLRVAKELAMEEDEARATHQILIALEMFEEEVRESNL